MQSTIKYFRLFFHPLRDDALCMQRGTSLRVGDRFVKLETWLKRDLANVARTSYLLQWCYIAYRWRQTSCCSWHWMGLLYSPGRAQCCHQVRWKLWLLHTSTRCATTHQPNELSSDNIELYTCIRLCFLPANPGNLQWSEELINSMSWEHTSSP